MTVTFGWQPLEDGIEVVFSKIAADGKTPLTYKTGDYWLIPARTATGEIEWPPYDPNAATSARPPMGIEHHYCRLGLVQFTGKTLTIREDCRNIFPPLTEIGMVPVVPAVRAMHVQEKGINWENDGVMQFNQFLSLIGNGGLTVKLDANIDPNSFADSNSKAPLSLGNMIVTIEVPFNAAFKNTLNTSLIVEGVVTLHGTIIIWKPSNFSQLSKNLNSLLKQLEVKIIMVRVILRGFAIWSKLKEPRLYLDGQAFGTPIAPTAPDLLNRKSRIDLRFPSGLGVQASDFQSWFFLDLTGN
ncbi:MAG: DUF6519 domain-containing protein, partial [Verrucomicrobia bacterium]|nr:DUF6519 domain-containing protein [Verrucomicrobiota bacterium]